MLKNISLIALFFPLLALSQTINKSINGTVVNPKLEPIPNATIKIVAGDTNGVVKKFAFSNAEGKILN
jgi:hypothetical protein